MIDLRLVLNKMHLMMQRDAHLIYHNMLILDISSTYALIFALISSWSPEWRSVQPRSRLVVPRNNPALIGDWKGNDTPDELLLTGDVMMRQLFISLPICLFQFPLPAESDHSSMLNKVRDFPYDLPKTLSSALVLLLTEVTSCLYLPPHIKPVNMNLYSL